MVYITEKYSCPFRPLIVHPHPSTVCLSNRTSGDYRVDMLQVTRDLVTQEMHLKRNGQLVLAIFLRVLSIFVICACTDFWLRKSVFIHCESMKGMKLKAQHSEQQQELIQDALILMVCVVPTVDSRGISIQGTFAVLNHESSLRLLNETIYT